MNGSKTSWAVAASTVAMMLLRVSHAKKIAESVLIPARDALAEQLERRRTGGHAQGHARQEFLKRTPSVYPPAS